MTKSEINEHIENQLSTLKDFQRSTVDVVCEKLYNQEKGRFLVADEVGLGKTIVAKGVICEGLKKAVAEDKKFKVVYICSNQALAGQNLRKLNILKDEKFIESTYSRLLFYAFKQRDQKDFQLSSLTPSTSFKFVKGTGWQEERKVIYTVLSRFDFFKATDTDLGLKLLLRGYVQQDTNEWSNNLNCYKNQCNEQIIDNIHFKLKSSLSNFKLEQYWSVHFESEIDARKDWDTWRAVKVYSEKITTDNYDQFKGPNRLISILRKCLTELCIEYLDADLFILDEFQRFKNLIDINLPEEELSEAALIAQKVFAIKGAKVLMLSATPFKAYSTRSEENVDDGEHFEEFKTVLSFLFEGNERIKEYEEARKELFTLLRSSKGAELEETPASKINLERLLRNIIARTERLIVSEDKDVLIEDSYKSDSDRKLMKVLESDIKNYLETDKVIKAMQDSAIRNVRSIVEYAKSSPYPFSFLEGYQIKRTLDANKSNIHIKRAIKASKNGWLDWKKIHEYKSLLPFPNAKFRYLFEHAFKGDLWNLLWLQPSLSYYKGIGVYSDQNLSSKTLVFSSWVMVPRMIAALLSYEAERRTIGDRRSYGTNEENRLYTYDGTTRRRPYPLLRLKRRNQKIATLTSFGFMYPSRFLADAFHPRKLGADESRDLLELVLNLIDKLETKFNELELGQLVSEDKTDSSWYWAFPLLLDLDHDQNVVESIDHAFKNSKVFLKQEKKQDGDEDYGHSANYDHIKELQSFAKDPAQYGLGRIPDDLFEVVALQVLASPAVCTYRLFRETFPDDPSLFTRSLDVATEFQQLFDKPESIAAIHINTQKMDGYLVSKSSPYWKEVLVYCACGNIQSMIDEFGHMIKSDFQDLESFYQRLANSINSHTTSVNVDSADSFLNNDTKKMRCHIAVSFGNQNMDKEEGRVRVTNMLENFNSPFRPFVLATTSMGQEGLDFHWYCRKIVHWNLPSNPIDFEQREGRINRYKGLVIRQNLAKKYSNEISFESDDLWSKLFEKAKEGEAREYKKPELVPFWHVEPDGVKIERLLPILPYSKEVKKLRRILDTLTLYRLTLGQPRQEELVDSLLKNLTEEQIALARKNLMIDLSPISYKEG